MNTASDIYTQRQIDRAAERERRAALEKQLHDEFLAGTPRAARANIFANQVLAMLGKFIPDACRSEAHDELLLNAFGLDVEIAQVPPERDAVAAARLKAAALTLSPQIIPKQST